ncbi:ATPase associated with various cellular activities AAA 5 [Halovivax asiaticus JCM 14624]|uniref:ATPase associated with various cellular activities AAA 5 n=2 Tax=Halovivax asiaticus TaxID=332953 RepID=M0BXB8_9EURY|nr:ATPase associated with various cellular activities AAA 5 [Halovivax asiaticus JCM 14624]
MFLTGDFEKLDLSRAVEAKYQRNSVARINDELSALTENCLSLSEANERCRRVGGTAFPAQGMFGTFRTDAGDVDYDRPVALVEAMSDDLTEVPAVNIHKPFSGALVDNSAEILDGLYFPDQQGREILEQIETALSAGKHILLTGPPGTGKTEIAERVSAHLARNHPYLFSGYEMTTATADWSTFDTVGGYMPNESDDSGENLSFNPGIVLNRLKRTNSGVQSNELTIIDELNRADIDKAFGQLFTLLSGQSVQLPYTVDGREVELTTYDDVSGIPDPNQYVVPNSWRIFATMNAYDKTSLYEMSYAFMRRFAFVRVPAPTIDDSTEKRKDPATDLVHNYAEAWDIQASQREVDVVGKVWRKANSAVKERSIGPAIIEDVLEYVSQHPEDRLGHHLTQATISYIFPQLEGVPKRKTIVQEIQKVPDIDQDLLAQAAQEMLQIPITEDA